MSVLLQVRAGEQRVWLLLRMVQNACLQLSLTLTTVLFFSENFRPLAKHGPGLAQGFATQVRTRGLRYLSRERDRVALVTSTSEGF